jgi:hypothetical protein
MACTGTVVLQYVNRWPSDCMLVTNGKLLIVNTLKACTVEGLSRFLPSKSCTASAVLTYLPLLNSYQYRLLL